MVLNSDKIIVRTISNVGVIGTHSIMGGNWGLNMVCKNIKFEKLGWKL